MIDLAVFSQTFPPRWQLGDTWVVSTKTEDTLRSRLDRLVFHTNEFLFEVVALPVEGAELARIIVTNRTPRIDKEAYELTFRTKPFSLAAYRVMYSRTGAVRYTREENGPNPFLGPRSSGLIVDFPVEPPEHALAGRLPFTSGSDRGVQTVEATPDGLRFVVIAGSDHHVFEWKRGEPWWSTFSRVLFIGRADEFEADSAYLVRQPAGR